MKQWTIGISSALAVTVVLCIIFWTEILATGVLMQARSTVPEEAHAINITTHTSEASNETSASETLALGSLLVPIPFTASERAVTDEYFRLVGADGIVVALLDDVEIRDSFFANENLTEEEADLLCDFLETTNEMACSSNYDFFTAMLEIDLGAPTLFSSNAQKRSTAALGIMRHLYLTSTEAQSIERFSTNTLRGYIIASSIDNYHLALFAPDDTQYTLITNLGETERDALLQSISVSQ